MKNIFIAGCDAQSWVVIILLNNRKYFCNNLECNHKTFAERFDFITSKSRKTKRLIEKILKLSTMVSSVSASQILEADMTIVGKSTICNLLKKNSLRYG